MGGVIMKIIDICGCKNCEYYQLIAFDTNDQMYIKCSYLGITEKRPLISYRSLKCPKEETKDETNKCILT